MYNVEINVYISCLTYEQSRVRVNIICLTCEAWVHVIITKIKITDLT